MYKKYLLPILIAMFVLAGCSQKVTTTTEPTSLSENPTPVLSPQSTGDSYLDPEGNFSFLYPNDYTLDTQDPLHPRVFKRGEMQRPQSEMSDGVILVFEVVNVGDKTFEEFVDERIAQSTADGMSEITEEKKATILNDFAGFRYSIRGLGEATNYIIRKDPNSQNALIITTLVADPQNIGYQEEVNEILSTVEMLK